jgi:BirA family biotin operon repressor/biotin-[acetyl-CoA-carboxylase] ligase
MVKRFWRLYLEETDSTQRYLKDLYTADPDLPPTLVWTTHQRAGYGRKGTPWISPPGKSLPFSFLERPQEPLPLWSARVALSLYETAKLWCGAPLYLKWPNDLYAPTGKLAGLLIEAQWHGSQLSAAFAGIGINIYATPFPTHLRATSLEALGHAPPSFEAFLDAFEAQYLHWEKASPPEVEAAFTARLWKEGPFRIRGRLIQGSIFAWKADGNLLLHTPQGPLQVEGHLVELLWPSPAWPWT